MNDGRAIAKAATAVFAAQLGVLGKSATGVGAPEPIPHDPKAVDS